VTDLAGSDARDREPAIPTTEGLVALARQVAEVLGPHGLTLSTAESCTGGLVSHALTEIPGSSSWYLGGAVVYSDRLKEMLAGVPAAMIVEHGAVSAEVARALADGVRTRFGSDLGIAVTGIAGPAGGSPTKPVGLTFVAVADRAGVVVERHVWGGDRSSNKRASAAAVLRLLLGRST
jgi:PncC family amidohydrolase